MVNKTRVPSPGRSALSWMFGLLNNVLGGNRKGSPVFSLGEFGSVLSWRVLVLIRTKGSNNSN